jgi:hypothetical protein
MKKIIALIFLSFVSSQVFANRASSMTDWQYETVDGSPFETILFLGAILLYMVAVIKICDLFCNSKDSAKKVLTFFTWGVNLLLCIFIGFKATSFLNFFIFVAITTFVAWMLYEVASGMVFKDIEERERLKDKDSL